MAVQKINGFAAPYRSQTFQQQANAQTARNGLLTMDGDVTQSLGTITVPAFSFIQSGLLISKDSALTIASPSMEAPYYLAVSAPTTQQVDDLVFTFAKTPLDLSANEVIVAAYDGLEWRKPPLLSIDGIVEERNQENIDFDNVGPYSGLLTTLDSPNYANSPGVLVDQQGLRQALLAEALFPVIAADDDYTRVDRIIYRRPDDSTNRIGTRRFMLGGTFDTSPATSHLATAFSSASVRQATKVLIGSDNAAHLFTTTGYGSTFQITYSKLSSDRTSVLVAPTNLQACAEAGFSVAIDQSDNLHVVFVSGLNNQIYYRKFSSTGVALTAATRIDTQSTPSSAPAVAIDPSGTKVFVVYHSLLGAANDQIFFTTRDLSGSLITAPLNLIGNSSDLVNADICVTDDLWVYVAWEDLTTGRIYYQAFDDIGVALSSFPAPVQVSGNTTRIGFGTLIDGATQAKIRVTDNKSVFVTFRQDKGASTYGISVWNDGEAFMRTLYLAGENITTYDLAVDSFMNGVHLITSRSGSTDYAKLEGQTVIFTLNLAGAASAHVATARDAHGSMLHLYSAALSGTYSSYDAGVSVGYIGPTVAAGGLNNITVLSTQLLAPTASFSQTPVAGDIVTISGSGVGNNGTKTITAVQTVSKDAPGDYYLVTVATAFAATEAGVTGDFQEPDGNAATVVKSTSEIASLAYRTDVLDTDLLLARISMPGSVILNYLIAGEVKLNANLFMPFGNSVDIDWGKTTPGEFTISGGLKILDMLNNVEYAVADGGYAMAEGEALYVMMDGVTLSPTPVVTLVENLPWSLPMLPLGVIKDGTFNPSLLANAAVSQLEDGEGDVIGEDLPLDQRTRLGITGETSYEAYSSTGVIAANDSHPTAISKLDNEVTALINNNPLEDTFAGDGVTAQPTFTTVVPGLSWSTDNTEYDIQVWVNGRRQDPQTVGPLTDGHFRKLTTTSFQVAGLVRTTSRVVVRKEGTSYGGPAAPAPGNLWSDPVDSDILPPDAAYDAGGPSNRFAEGHFANALVHQLTLQSATLGGLTLVKTKTNGDASTLLAGKPASLYSDGKIYKADSDSVTGQKMYCIVLNDIAPGAQGLVMLFYFNIPGAITGLGFAPGDEVFLSETGAYTNGVSGFTGGDDTIARIGWADCADGVASPTATDLALCYQTIVSAP